MGQNIKATNLLTLCHRVHGNRQSTRENCHSSQNLKDHFLQQIPEIRMIQILFNICPVDIRIKVKEKHDSYSLFCSIIYNGQDQREIFKWNMDYYSGNTTDQLILTNENCQLSYKINCL